MVGEEEGKVGARNNEMKRRKKSEMERREGWWEWERQRWNGEEGGKTGRKEGAMKEGGIKRRKKEERGYGLNGKEKELKNVRQWDNN